MIFYCFLERICGDCFECPSNDVCEDAELFRFSTQTGCPSCDNNDIYLVQCNSLIWKVCEKCKSVFHCEDAMDIFTDYDMKDWLLEGKPLSEYMMSKFKHLSDKYIGYNHSCHPPVM